MNLYALLLTTLFSVTGCSTSNESSIEENVGTTNDPMRDRTWTLTAVQDNTGNVTPVAQAADFEFTLRLSSQLVPPGGDVMQAIESVGGMNVCNHYSGGYTLENNVLSLVSVSEDARDCERAAEPAARQFGRVLFTSSHAAMISLENDRLVIASGDNEQLIFTQGKSVAFSEFHRGF